MATHALIIFILFLCASIYTEVKCDLTCSNMLECTMYNLQQVSSKVDGMQSNMAAIANQLSQIQVQIATDTEEMQQQMGTDEENMKQQMATDKEEMQQQMETDKEEMQQQIETVRAEMQQQMATEIEEMQQQVDTDKEEMQEEMVSQKEEIQNLTLELESHLSENSTPEKEELSGYVSFLAYATEIRDYNAGDHVMFDATMRNYGSAYSVLDSEFICPLDAYYMISVTLLADQGALMMAAIMIDDYFLVALYAQDYAAPPSASQTVVSYCGMGHRIWVKCINNNNRLFGIASPYTTFSASLLRVT